MTEREHHPALEEDEALVELLRRSTDPELDAGAAERIADGAWIRARAKKNARPPRLRLLPRIGLAAAAAVIVAVGFSAMMGTEPLLAVEGDPVQVWRGQAWEPDDAVAEGEWVHVPEGNRALRVGSDSRIEPVPGSIFRVVRTATTHVNTAPFRVEVKRGSAQVQGASLWVSLSGMEVHPQKGGGEFRIEVALNGGHGPTEAPDVAPYLLAFEASAMPRVNVMSGTFIVKSDGEKLELDSNQGATVVRWQSGVRFKQRLARMENFSDQVIAQVIAGSVVRDANVLPSGGFALVLEDQGASVTRVQVPAQLRELALRQLNGAFHVFATLHTDDAPGLVKRFDLRHDGLAEGFARWKDIADAVNTATVREFTVTKDGRTLTVAILANGHAELREDDQVRKFASLGALRSEAPDAAAFFGTHLPD